MRPQWRKEDEERIRSHTLKFSFVRKTPGTGEKSPAGLDPVNLDCTSLCTVCGHVVMAFLREESYESPEEARERAIKSLRRGYRFDCADRLAREVMES